MHWFGVCGIANGLAVMLDEESQSLWDHITGEAFEGPLAGRRLEFWPISLTTVEAARLKNPDIPVLRSSHASLTKWLASLAHRSAIDGRGFLPPGFRGSMSGPVDARLDEMTQGLGVIAGDQGKFYPMQAVPKGGAVEDTWLGRGLVVKRGEIDGVPSARWQDTGERPMQLLTRWYGFSFTYPGCEVYPPEDTR